MKGTSSAVLLSVLIHAGLFLLAGLLVIFTVIDKPEPRFEPPPAVERPKMKLKKPQVKLKKTSKPKQTSRIVSKVKRANMPDIQLPEMGGMGDGLAGGLGEFGLSFDVEEMSMLGTTKSIGSDLEGTFYDFNRTRGGAASGVDLITWREGFRRFLTSGWKTSTLSRYYQYPQKLYASCLVFPPAPSSIAPSAFGDKDASGAFWLVHYKGQIVHGEDITFRFWANSDENLVIRVDGEIVIAATWVNVESGEETTEPNPIAGLWDTSDGMMSRRYFMGNNRAVVGDWITLEAGVPQDIEIVIGDNGGQACFIVAVEEKGVEYPKTYQGGPLLPAFKTAQISRDMLDVIYKNLVDDEISLTTGPVFNDYDTSLKPSGDAAQESGAVSVEPVPDAAPAKPASSGNGMRTWTLTGSERFEAQMVTTMGTEVVLKTPDGKTVKVPRERLSLEDKTYVELSRPPVFKINFIKKDRQKTFVMEHISLASEIRPPETRTHYGVRLKQTSAANYDHELRVEFFAVGQERLGQTYILLDRKETRFTPTKENERSHEFISGREVVLENYEIEDEPRGEDYSGYLVTVTDERGEIIAVESSIGWLRENLQKLQELYPGNYMDKECNRVFPTRPPRTRY